ncbi:MAG: hypothetical protein H6741_32905 [Alphaproteobacteria bacterium]|nr:hypothetical protein [Alphaproteobacteria bacterium]MCB9797516.1 hypothetical protein [Alphaproteobacteria bacterium]
MKRFITGLFFLSLGLVACTGAETTSTPETPETPEAPEAPAVDPRVEKAASVGKAAAKNPDGVEDALKAQGMSIDDYEALMYDIAADPELSAQYKKAMGG